MFFKEAKIKRKYNEANKILEEKGVFKKIGHYRTLMQAGKENEANRLRAAAMKEMSEVINKIGITEEELMTIKKNMKKWDK